MYLAVPNENLEAAECVVTEHFFGGGGIDCDWETSCRVTSPNVTPSWSSDLGGVCDDLFTGFLVDAQMDIKS